MSLNHLSFSQLNMLLRCGVQYERRYVNGEKIAPSGSMVRGRCGHKSEEVNFRQKIKSNEDLPLETVKDIFSDEWEKSKYQIAWAKDEIDGGSPSKVEGEYKDVGISLVDVYHRELAPAAIPIAVEDKFTVHFDGGYPDLVGIIDRIDEGDQIVDLKFVGKSPSEGDAAKDLQLICYDLGYRQTRKKKPSLLRKEYAISTKKPKTMIQEVPAFQDEQIQALLRRLERAIIAIGKGVFLPAAIGSWGCSEKWCGFWNSCAFRQG